jgi:hypothetical protein
VRDQSNPKRDQTLSNRRTDLQNKATAADALRVEVAFQARVVAFATPPAAELQAPIAQPPEVKPAQLEKRSRTKKIDKAALTLAEPRRVRGHVRYVATRPCLVCGRSPSDAHHLRFAQNRALSRMVSDEFIVPLCRGHHRAVHGHGDEVAWWQYVGIDPSIAARSLWLETHQSLGGTDPAGTALILALSRAVAAPMIRGALLRQT